MARTIEQVNQDYGMTCARLGDVTFKLAALQEECGKAEYEQTKLTNKLKSLNEEARKLQMAAQAENTPQPPVVPEAAGASSEG